ncbi:Acylamidase [compost metagenome]
MNELLKASAFELADKIAKKEVSPTEVLDVHIHRIEEVNGDLNAMVENDFVRARKLAHEQTERLAKSTQHLPPLFGVPFTVKEMFSYAGMKRTGGSVHRKFEVMDWDSTVVARMKKMGAIPMGTTNVPELGFWFETHNVVYGRTNNPYDVKRTCGGSSGGEGALIGAGASPMGLGSDIGGSIRMPAFFCGITGHKPSRYLLPLTGHFPYGQNDFQNLTNNLYPYTSMGPMARRASDLYPLTQILHGADGFDPMTLKDPRLDFPVKDWSKVKVFIMPDPVFHGASRTSEELQQSVRNCGKLFEELGAQVEELDPRFFVNGISLWFNALASTKNKQFHEILRGPQESFSFGKEMLKLAIGKPNYIFPNLMVALGEILDPRKNPDFTKGLEALGKMHMALEEKLGDDGILILPPHPRVAPKHRAPLWTPFDFIFTGIFNMLGVPATSVPTGLNSEGLPLGVQIVAGYLKDNLTLSCAEFIESTFGGWTPPPSK